MDANSAREIIDNYRGEALEEFLDDEKYYASQRAGKDVGKPAVVDAFARCALDFLFFYEFLE